MNGVCLCLFGWLWCFPLTFSSFLFRRIFSHRHSGKNVGSQYDGVQSVLSELPTSRVIACHSHQQPPLTNSIPTKSCTSRSRQRLDSHERIPNRIHCPPIPLRNTETNKDKGRIQNPSHSQSGISNDMVVMHPFKIGLIACTSSSAQHIATKE